VTVALSLRQASKQLASEGIDPRLQRRVLPQAVSGWVPAACWCASCRGRGKEHAPPQGPAPAPTPPPQGRHCSCAAHTSWHNDHTCTSPSHSGRRPRCQLTQGTCPWPRRTPQVTGLVASLVLTGGAAVAGFYGLQAAGLLNSDGDTRFSWEDARKASGAGVSKKQEQR